MNLKRTRSAVPRGFCQVTLSCSDKNTHFIRTSLVNRPVGQKCGATLVAVVTRHSSSGPYQKRRYHRYIDAETQLNGLRFIDPDHG